MEVGKLTVELREGTGKGACRKLRAKGLVPGICYGEGLEQPLQITLDPKALKASLDPIKRQNTVIDLAVVDNGSEKTRVTAMLREYQVHPIKRVVTHVDLVAIDPDKTVHVDVPVEFIGKAFGTIEGGQLHIVRREIPVRCKPADIPASFTVDVTPLDIGMVLHISDLVMPAGIEPTVSTGLSLVTCVAPRVEVVETTEEEGLEGVEGEGEGEGAEGEGDKKAETTEKKD